VPYTEVVQLLHNQHWPSVRDALCPSGHPNAAWGPTVFQLARQQLGITEQQFVEFQQQSKHSFQKPHPNRELTYRFFHGQFQNATYQLKDSIAYIPIWKAANMAIRGWMVDTLGAGEEMAVVFIKLSYKDKKYPRRDKKRWDGTKERKDTSFFFFIFSADGAY
jgi:hypothetical protein